MREREREKHTHNSLCKLRRYWTPVSLSSRNKTPPSTRKSEIPSLSFSSPLFFSLLCDWAKRILEGKSDETIPAPSPPPFRLYFHPFSLSLSLSPSTQNNVITASFLFLFQMMYNTQNKERDSGRQTKLIMNIINII